jgi:hypothetical protein
MVGMPVNEVKFVVFGRLGDSVRLVVVVPGDIAWQAGNAMPYTIASMVHGTPAIAASVWASRSLRRQLLGTRERADMGCRKRLFSN